LNSRLFWFFIQQTGYVLRGGYFTFKTNYINPFPIPNDIPHSTVEYVDGLVSKILETKKNSAGASVSDLEMQVDEAIYKLYKITDAEIETINALNLMQ
jgi:hypothetical protein